MTDLMTTPAAGALAAEAGPPRTTGPLVALLSAYAVRLPVRTVAVVGNAPLLPDARRAASIDDADLVIRVNGFALDEPGGAPTVGRRADVVVLQWAVRATPWLFEDYSHRLYLLNEPGRVHWDVEVVPPWWPADLGLVPIPNREVTLPLVTELGLDRAERPQWATTGTTAVVLAAHAFPDAVVRVTGFSMLEDTEQRSWAHAYGAPSPVNDEHDLRAEAALLRRMTAAGRVEVLP
ncbi:hypothetical protein [Modestobacter sp. SYSU DS0290]